jgi:hypothetical protein
MTPETKSTPTDRIRALNDALRKNFGQGHAVMTTGIAALGAEAVARIVKTVEVYESWSRLSEQIFRPVQISGASSMTTFATPTTHTKNMTLARSKPTATPSFSRSIITIPH